MPMTISTKIEVVMAHANPLFKARTLGKSNFPASLALRLSKRTTNFLITKYHFRLSDDTMPYVYRIRGNGKVPASLLNLPQH